MRAGLLLLSGVLLIAAPALGADQILTAPWDINGINLQQGWIYSYPPYAQHSSLDYVNGAVDASASWQAFPLVAMYDGTATYFTGDNGGRGNYVALTWQAGGHSYDAQYCHLASAPFTAGVPVAVRRGDLLGTAGATGSQSNGLLHLHLQTRVDGALTDLYGLNTQRSSYPEFGGNCGANRYWTTCPPSKPSYLAAFSSGTLSYTATPSAIVHADLIYQNTGSAPWSGDGTKRRYVELHSTTSAYNADQSSTLAWNWLGGTNYKICTTTGGNPVGEVNPGGGLGLYAFDMKAPSTPGTYQLHVALYHPTSGTYLGGGRSITLVVVTPAYAPMAADFTGDSKSDVALYEAATGGWFVATSTGSAFVPSPFGWLGNWGANATAYKPLTGDFNGDGKADVGLYEAATGGWFVATSTGSAFVPSPFGWLGNWGANATAYRPLTGDFNSDGKTDVGLYEPATGGWYVALSTGSSFVPAASGWLGNWGANATAYRAIVGWFNTGGACDVGLYEPATGGWYVALSTGSSFVPAPAGWLGNWGANATAYQNLTGDYTGEGRSDVCLYEAATGGWYVATSTGSAFVPSPFGWLGNWGANATAYRPITGDFTGDGKADVCLYEPATGGWFEATSTGSAFTASPAAWLGNWGIYGSGKMEQRSLEMIANERNSLSTPEWLAVHPNPTNRALRMEFALFRTGPVSLVVYDVQGRQVATLIAADYPAGHHVIPWNGTDDSGADAPSGIYFARLATEGKQLTQKCVILR